MKTFVYSGSEFKANPFRPGIEYNESDIVVRFVDAVIEEAAVEEKYYRAKGTLVLAKAQAQENARTQPNDRLFKTMVDAIVAQEAFELEELRADLAIARARAKCVRVVLNAMYGSVYEGEEQHDE